MRWLKSELAILGFFILALFVFFAPVWKEAKIPIAADALVGLYHPFRDLLAQEFPNGVPYKNFLVTDPFRQQFIWKLLSVEQLKQGKIPWWNPYTLSGTPLLATFQAGVFYPLNVIFLLPDFVTAWTIFIVLQPLLGGIFVYLFLREQKLKPMSALIGLLSFVGGGFFMVWLEWGNIGHTILWLPLSLWSIDRYLKTQKTKFLLLNSLSLSLSFFAGHLQTVFYVVTLSAVYAMYRLCQFPKETKKKLTKHIALSFILFGILTAPQWFPTQEFVRLSARSTDQVETFTRNDWFIPWQHLAQLVAPDFFGNPSTLNYWGVWNYAEFVGYIGLIPLIFALAAAFSWKKEVRFWIMVVVVSLLFSLPNPIAKIPFLLNLPFLSQAQPSRLLSLTTFALAVLGALGFDQWLKERRSNRLGLATLIVGGAVGVLWIAAVRFVPAEYHSIALRNLVLPTLMVVGFAAGLGFFALLENKRNKRLKVSLFVIFNSLFLMLVAFDLFRFGRKFTPFSPRAYVFPKTQTLTFLQSDKGTFRIMSLDRRILPPNVAAAYKLQTIEGYDPLYLKAYADVVTELETGHGQDRPIAFNRIITPQNVDSTLIDTLNVKYVLSLTELSHPKLKLVFQEGETRVYQNSLVEPRARITEGRGEAAITKYEENQVWVTVNADQESTLELADMMYPGWQVQVDGKLVPMHASDLNFRQVQVPAGEHEVIFFYSMLKGTL